MYLFDETKIVSASDKSGSEFALDCRDNINFYYRIIPRVIEDRSTQKYLLEFSSIFRFDCTSVPNKVSIPFQKIDSFLCVKR